MKQMIVFACGLLSAVLRRQTLQSMVAESFNQLQPLLDSPFLSPSKYPYQTRCFCKKAVQRGVLLSGWSTPVSSRTYLDCYMLV